MIYLMAMVALLGSIVPCESVAQGVRFEQAVNASMLTLPLSVKLIDDIGLKETLSMEEQKIEILQYSSKDGKSYWLKVKFLNVSDPLNSDNIYTWYQKMRKIPLREEFGEINRNKFFSQIESTIKIIKKKKDFKTIINCVDEKPQQNKCNHSIQIRKKPSELVFGFQRGLLIIHSQ